MQFFIVGHSKHSNDRFFGYISTERKKRVSVESIFDVEDVVRHSSVCNKAVMIRTKELENNVKYYDWTKFLAKKYTNIPSYKRVFETSHFFRI